MQHNVFLCIKTSGLNMLPENKQVQKVKFCFKKGIEERGTKGYKQKTM